MCAVPSIAVFCNESIECFPGTASKFFLKLLVTTPVAPIINIIIIIIIIITVSSVDLIVWLFYFRNGERIIVQNVNE
jgi:hypothetical protein